MELNAIAGIFYLISTTGYFLYLFFQKNKFYKTGFYMLFAGFLFNTAAIVNIFMKSGFFYLDSVSKTLFFAGWASVFVFIIFHFMFKIKILGIYAAPLAALAAIGTCNFLQPTGAMSGKTVMGSIWLITHIITVFISEASFTLACGIGILYVIQQRTIKTKKHGFFFQRLPSLELLDRAGYVCIIAGFSFLTLGLISGMIYANSIWGRPLTFGHREIWSGITWVLYAILLHQRIALGWRGYRAAIMSIVCFAVLVFTSHFLWC